MLDAGTKLLHDMLESRLSHKELGTKYDLSPRPDREKNMYPCELPDHVVVALLKREALFHTARLHTAQMETLAAKERLRTLRTKQSQGEPKFDRWKAELEAPYKTLQTTGAAKQLPRTHAGVVMEHTELVDNFENLGAVLRGYEVEEQEVVLELKDRDEGITKLSGWADNLLNMATTLEQMGGAELPSLAEGLAEGVTCPCCNTANCTSMGRTMAQWGQFRRAQTDQLHQTAVMLKQAFQTVCSFGVCHLAAPDAMLPVVNELRSSRAATTWSTLTDMYISLGHQQLLWLSFGWQGFCQCLISD
ncbi:TPA: hypothetical protein ACH3X1_006427 [Trebouxia sp. C0004]